MGGIINSDLAKIAISPTGLVKYLSTVRRGSTDCNNSLNIRTRACDRIRLTMNDHKATTQTRRTAVEAAMATAAVFVAGAFQQGDASAQEYRNPFSKIRRTEDILGRCEDRGARRPATEWSSSYRCSRAVHSLNGSVFPDEIRVLAKRHILDTLAATCRTGFEACSGRSALCAQPGAGAKVR